MRLVGGLMLLLAAPVNASSLQDQYNAAQSAFDAGRMTEARDGFSAILPRLDASPRTATQAAIVRARLGSAALATHDAETAAALLARAVAALPRGGDDWQVAELDLGRAYEVSLAYDKAAAAYQTLLSTDAVPDDAKLLPIIGLVRVLTFSDPEAARRYADEALARAGKLATTKRNDTVAQLQSLRGRIELNDGKLAEARKWFDMALASAGGLGTRVNVADLRIRGDLALAAFLMGDLEGARKYLAYTGSGQLPDQGFELGADMPLPACAPAGEVRRDDMAIVEFGIADDGRVNGVVPVYVSRRGGPERAFAKAVRTWSWRPAAAKALPGFWRQSVRMELRCVNRGPDEGEQWGVGRDVESWLAENAFEPMPETLRGDAASLPILRAELARRGQKYGAGSPELLPVLLRIGENHVVPPTEAQSADLAGLEIAKASGAPKDLALYFRMQQVRHAASGKRDGAARVGLDELLSNFDKEGAGQSRGAALVAAYLGAYATYRNQPKQMEAAYRRILATPLTAMPDSDPLRQTARIQLASLEASASRIESARTLLAQTGLSPDQCSLFPITPIQTNSGGGQFPNEALQWHFEGNVRVAYDLDPSGRPIDVRTVIASPPLVFSSSTEAIARGLRYKPIFRDGAAVGCSDLQKGVRYRIQ